MAFTNKELQELQELHALCVRTLRGYIDEAERTCLVLGEIDKFPVTMEVREKIVQQRQAENSAYDRYLIARQRLFEAAQWN